MSDHRLPENLEDWPQSPHEILGITSGAAPRDVKTAYAKLIRVYKPEIFPEQFRRIREAYEQAMAQAEYLSQYSFPADWSFDTSSAEKSSVEKTTTDAPAASDVSGQDHASRAEPSQGDSGRREGTDAKPKDRTNFGELWTRAAAGDRPAAYADLKEWERTHPGHALACAQLYWLLAIFPELDPGTHACEWLLRGMEISGPRGPLAELYRREVANNSEEAFGPRCNRLIERFHEDADLDRILMHRWKMALEHERWQILFNDIDLFQSSRQLSLGRLQFHRMFFLVNHTTWLSGHEARRLTEIASESLMSATDLHLELTHLLTRLDQLREIASQWHNLAAYFPTQAELLDVIRRAWNDQYPEMLDAWERLTQRWVKSPQTAMRVVDYLMHNAPILLNFLFHTWFNEVPVDEPADVTDDDRRDQILELVRVTVEQNTGKSFEKLWLEILKLAATEIIPWETLLFALRRHQLYDSKRQVTFARFLEISPAPQLLLSMARYFYD